MKVYRVKSDVNKFIWLMPDVPDSEILDYITFDCARLREDWSQPPTSVYDKSAIEGDFAYYTSGALVVSPDAINKVRAFFESAGELLPLWCEGDLYTLLNVTVCVDVLDHSKTEWHKAKDGSKVSIKNIAFEEEKIATQASSIFKIPETCRGSVLTWEIDGNPEREFKAFVEEKGLTGLLFEELWDSEKK